MWTVLACQNGSWWGATKEKLWTLGARGDHKGDLMELSAWRAIDQTADRWVLFTSIGFLTQVWLIPGPSARWPGGAAEMLAPLHLACNSQEQRTKRNSTLPFSLCIEKCWGPLPLSPLKPDTWMQIWQKRLLILLSRVSFRCDCCSATQSCPTLCNLVI